MGTKPELGETSFVVMEVVSPLPAIEIQTTKHVMETNPARKEKIEPELRPPVASIGLEPVPALSFLKPQSEPQFGAFTKKKF